MGKVCLWTLSNDLSDLGETTVYGIFFHYRTVFNSVGCTFFFEKNEARRLSKVSFPFGLLTRFTALQGSGFHVSSGHSHLTLSKATWPRFHEGEICVLCAYKLLLSFFSYLLKCELTITLESLSTAQPVVRGSSWGVWGGFKCGGGDVDVGNRGESSKRVTEGGQECKQGMLGNQQVWSCFCVRIPPCSKDRL